MYQIDGERFEKLTQAQLKKSAYYLYARLVLEGTLERVPDEFPFLQFEDGKRVLYLKVHLKGESKGYIEGYARAIEWLNKAAIPNSLWWDEFFLRLPFHEDQSDFFLADQYDEMIMGMNSFPFNLFAGERNGINPKFVHLEMGCGLMKENGEVLCDHLKILNKFPMDGRNPLIEFSSVTDRAYFTGLSRSGFSRCKEGVEKAWMRVTPKPFSVSSPLLSLQW